MLARIIDGTLLKFDNDDMSSGYLGMLEGFGDYFIEVINVIVEGHRILFHCTAGKDRTGVMAMVLLGLAGVSAPYLLDDYEISQQYLRPQLRITLSERRSDLPASTQTISRRCGNHQEQ